MERNSTLDVTKFIAIVAVVLIHATAPIANKGLDTFLNYGWYRPLLSLGVPLFFATSGFLLYRKGPPARVDSSYTWNYSLRILGYYAVATLLHVAFSFVLAGANRLFISTPLRPALARILENWNYKNLFNGTIGWYHLYFLTALFGACLLLMIFQRVSLDSRFMLMAGSVLYLLGLIGYVRIDEFFRYGGVLKGFFYVALGYFVASLDTAKIRRPELGLATSTAVYYFCAIYATSIVILPMALIVFYGVTLCAKYPTFGTGSLPAKLGTKSLEIFIFHDISRVLVERAFVYSGVSNFYESPWYFLVAIPFSLLFPLFIFRLAAPLFATVSMRASMKPGSAA